MELMQKNTIGVQKHVQNHIMEMKIGFVKNATISAQNVMDQVPWTAQNVVPILL